MRLPNQAYTMKKNLLFLFLFCSFAVHAQVQPQFKFYLAFEDAKHEKDTVWLIIDESANLSTIDSAFGEDSIAIDSNAFGVYAVLPGGAWSKTSAQNIDVGVSSEFVYAFNQEYPITMSWDTNLLKVHNLPFEIRSAYVYNDWIYFNSFPPEGFDLLWNWAPPGRDSLILPYFEMGGGPAEHFPLQVTFSDEKRYLNVSETGDKENGINVFPNPTSDLLTIQTAHKNSETEACIKTLSGELVEQFQLIQGTVSLSTRQYKAGIYILSVTNSKNIFHEIIVISR